MKKICQSKQSTTHATPSKSTRQIVASAQWQNCDSRLRCEIHLIQNRQNPTNGTITSTRQNPQIRHIFEQFQSKWNKKNRFSFPMLDQYSRIKIIIAALTLSVVRLVSNRTLAEDLKPSENCPGALHPEKEGKEEMQCFG